MIRRLVLPCSLVLALAIFVRAQNRDVNWPTYGGDAQRSGWQKTETRITKDNVKDLQLLWKMKLEAQPKGTRPILPPLILGRLISYRGFKELAFTATNTDLVYAIDVDLGKMFWQKHLEYNSSEPQAAGTSSACPGGLTAMPVMPTPAPPARGGPPAPRPTGPFVAGPASVYVISSDGRLHRLNTSTGDDMVQPVSVLPANAHASSLNIVDNVIYAVTSGNCDDAPDAVWAIDLNADTPKVASFPLTGAANGRDGGVAIGTDGTVYAASRDTVYALSPRDLQMRHTFKVPAGTIKGGPVVFNYRMHDFALIAEDDEMDLLDSSSLQDVDRVKGSMLGIRDISTFEDGGTRSILAGMPGGIVAYKVEDEGGHPALKQTWLSHQPGANPSTTVIANGVVFGLTGTDRAILYSLDAATGKSLYSSRNVTLGRVSSSALTVANGRVYFGTGDGTLNAFGIPMEH